MFSSSPKLKAEPRTARGAFRATPTGVPKPVPSPAPLKPSPLLSTPKATADAAPGHGGQILPFLKYSRIHCIHRDSHEEIQCNRRGR